MRTSKDIALPVALALCMVGCATSGLPVYDTPESCAEAFVRAEVARDWDALVACWAAYARDALREDFRRAAEHMREHAPREPDPYREVFMGIDHALARDGIAVARVRLRHPRDGENALDPETPRWIPLVWEDGSWRRTEFSDEHRELHRELDAMYPAMTDDHWQSWRLRREPDRGPFT